MSRLPPSEALDQHVDRLAWRITFRLAGFMAALLLLGAVLLHGTDLQPNVSRGGDQSGETAAN